MILINNGSDASLLTVEGRFTSVESQKRTVETGNATVGRLFYQNSIKYIRNLDPHGLRQDHDQM